MRLPTTKSKSNTSAQDHPKRTKPVPLSLHRSQQVAAQSKHQAVSAQTQVTSATKKTTSQQVSNKQRTDYDTVS